MFVYPHQVNKEGSIPSPATDDKMEEDEEITTIRLKKSVRKRLDKFGEKGDTYENILNKLMDLAEGIKKKVK